MLAEVTLKELVRAVAKGRHLSMEKLAREADMSLRQFVTLTNDGFTDGTRLGTVKKLARVLDKEPSELIRLTIEE